MTWVRRRPSELNEARAAAGRREPVTGASSTAARCSWLASTLASRIGGFVREILSAALFGDASPIFDAFITAWRMPNLFRRFLGEGALATALQTDADRRRRRPMARRPAALCSWPRCTG